MKQTLKQIDAYPMRWLVGACSVVMICASPACFGQGGGAFQPAATPASAPAQTSLPAQAPGLGSGRLGDPATSAASVAPAAKPASAVAPASAPSGAVNGGALHQMPASSTPATPPAAPPAQHLSAFSEDEEESKTPAKPGHEGVKVHGHWVPQLKNADGTLGERREFENSLVGGFGDKLLLGVLSGVSTPGDLSIGLVSGASGTTNSAAWCQGTGGTPPAGVSCYGLIGNDGWVNFWKNLYVVTQTTLTSVVNFNTSDTIVLTANFVNQASYGLTSLSSVVTRWIVTTPSFAIFFSDNNAFGLSTNAPNISLSSPGSGTDADYDYSIFTATQIAGGPVSVSAGQTVMVTVTISFS